MPIQVSYPGVYIQELPSGTHTITSVATSTTAIIGYLRRGPVNKPVMLTNFGDFQRVFGGMDPQSEASYQINQFFLNGGSTAWVTRIFSSASLPVLPAATIQGGPMGGGKSGGSGLAPPTGVTSLNIMAANPGTWGLNVYVTVDYLGAAPGTFNLYATEYNFSGSTPSVVRTMSFGGVSMDATASNYIVEVLNSSGNPDANLIALSDPNPPPAGSGYTPGQAPFPTGTVLQFAPPAQVATSQSLTVTLQRPASGSQTPTPLSATIPVPNIQTLESFVAAVQSALAASAASLGCPALASARVRAFTSPFPPASSGGGGGSGAADPSNMVHILLTDPGEAGTLVGVSSTNSKLFTQLQTNTQAVPLTVTKPKSSGGGGTGKTPTPPPDGAPPSGTDIAGSQVNRTGIYAFDAVDIVNILCVPDLRNMDDGNYLTASTTTLNYAILRRAVAILDIPKTLNSVQGAEAWVSSTPPKFGQGVISAAAYFPELQVPDPFGSQPRQIGASGTMAGLYAATDGSRGVWKAPAGIQASLAGVLQLAYTMTDQENGLLNPVGMNALRTFPIYGNIAWGARTLAAANPADDDWKYVPVRRLALNIEQSLVRGLQWVVFEPNDATLWAQIRLAVNGFLHGYFQQGAFVGTTPDQAYQCVCDASTTTAEDMDNGIVNILVMFAPVKPAEFVVISIQQMAGQTSS
ncbi:MAG: phage tail sheath C-terminal domain-containing protein [Alphaproteobacteria bacterium]